MPLTYVIARLSYSLILLRKNIKRTEMSKRAIKRLKGFTASCCTKPGLTPSSVFLSTKVFQFPGADFSHIFADTHMGNLCSGYSRSSGSESCIIDPVSDTDFMGGKESRLWERLKSYHILIYPNKSLCKNKNMVV